MHLELIVFCLVLMTRAAICNAIDIQAETSICSSLDVNFVGNKKVKYEDLLSRTNDATWRNCLKKCARRQPHCKAVSFFPEERTCDLGILGDAFLENSDSRKVMTVSIDTFDIYQFEEVCRTNHCSEQESCIPLTIGGFYCSLDLCGTKRERPHSTHRGGGRDLGTVVTYSCDAGYVLQGDQNVTCKGNGWSRASFYCARKTCPGHFSKSGGECFEVYDDVITNYKIKRDRCLDSGAILANVSSEHARVFYGSQLTGSDVATSWYLIDGRRYSNSQIDEYSLYDGSTFLYNQSSSESFCLYLLSNGEIRDDGCYRESGAICEIRWNNPW